MPREVVATLERAGFAERRQRGSHLIMQNVDSGAKVIVPIHVGDMPRGTLKSIIVQSGRSDDEFMALL